MTSITAKRSTTGRAATDITVGNGSVSEATPDRYVEVTDRASDVESRPVGQTVKNLHRLQHDNSILTLAVGEKFLYAGTQEGEILVWSLTTFELVVNVQAHKRAVVSQTPVIVYTTY
jgi:di- and tripeptidase